MSVSYSKCSMMAVLVDNFICCIIRTTFMQYTSTWALKTASEHEPACSKDPVDIDIGSLRAFALGDMRRKGILRGWWWSLHGPRRAQNETNEVVIIYGNHVILEMKIYSSCASEYCWWHFHSNDLY